MASNLYIKNTKDMGRGVFARLPILAGHIIEECHCIVLGGEDDKKLQDSILRFYCFGGAGLTSVLALGYGSLYNHAPDGAANAMYTYDGAHNMITFTSIRNIEEGEQVLINYGYNPLVELEKWEIRKTKNGSK